MLQLGATGVGAAGLGAAGLSEHRKNEYQQSGGSGAGSSGYQAGGAATAATDDDSTLPGPAPHTAGPHRYDWLNKLDPRVNANPEEAEESRTGGKSNTTGSDQHYGRDAAVGAGIGGVGGAAYSSTKKSHKKTDSGVAGISPATKTSGSSDPYSSKTATTSDQKYDSQYTTGQKTGNNMTTSTTGYQGTVPAKGYQTAPTTGAAGYQSTAPTQGYQSATAADTAGAGDHYGRDAAIVGGGTAALGGAAALGEHQYQSQ